MSKPRIVIRLRDGCLTVVADGLIDVVIVDFDADPSGPYVQVVEDGEEHLHATVIRAGDDTVSFDPVYVNRMLDNSDYTGD